MSFSPVSSITAHFTYTDPEETTLETSKEYCFCAISLQMATGKIAYAQAISKVASDTLGLKFQAQEEPFPEMALYISQNKDRMATPANGNIQTNYYHLHHWVQKYEPRNRAWQIYKSVENSSAVQRMLVNIQIEESLTPSEGILKAIAAFKKLFPCMNPEESAVIVKYAGLRPFRADKLLSPGSLTEIRLLPK